jgi:hypothetical protein
VEGTPTCMHAATGTLEYISTVHSEAPRSNVQHVH